MCCSWTLKVQPGGRELTLILILIRSLSLSCLTFTLLTFAMMFYFNDVKLDLKGKTQQLVQSNIQHKEASGELSQSPDLLMKQRWPPDTEHSRCADVIVTSAFCSMIFSHAGCREEHADLFVMTDQSEHTVNAARQRRHRPSSGGVMTSVFLLANQEHPLCEWFEPNFFSKHLCLFFFSTQQLNNSHFNHESISAAGVFRLMDQGVPSLLADRSTRSTFSHWLLILSGCFMHLIRLSAFKTTWRYSHLHLIKMQHALKKV